MNRKEWLASHLVSDRELTQAEYDFPASLNLDFDRDDLISHKDVIKNKSLLGRIVYYGMKIPIIKYLFDWGWENGGPEAILARDWDTPEEDEAWKDL